MTRGQGCVEEDSKGRTRYDFGNVRRWSKESLGRSNKLSRPWVGSKTSEKIKERKEAKLKLEGARSE